MRTIGVWSASLFLLSSGCDNSMPCPDASIPDLSAKVVDMATQGPDLAGTGVCGPNTMLDPNTGKCLIAASACLSGTMLDPTTSTCKVIVNFGTMIFSSTFWQDWSFFYQPNMMDGGIPDGGAAFTKIADATGALIAGVPDTQPMFTRFGDQFGFPTGGKIPVKWAVGPDSYTYLAFDHQITVGEWKQCKGSYTVYKNPPDTAKHFYKVVVDVAGCPHDLTFTAWGTYSPDGTFPNRTLTVPLGGLPQVFVINGAGTGHFERNIDPSVWFLSGGALPGQAHTAVVGMIPDLTKSPSAGFWVDILTHPNGQPNGNAGFCERDVNNNCITPPPPVVYLPGQFYVDTQLGFLGVSRTGMGNPVAMPLGMLQPY